MSLFIEYVCATSKCFLALIMYIVSDNVVYICWILRIWEDQLLHVVLNNLD